MAQAQAQSSSTDSPDSQPLSKEHEKESKSEKKIDFSATIKTYLRYGGAAARQDFQGEFSAKEFSPVRQGFGLDIYESTLGFKASLPLFSAWELHARGALDLIEFTSLSDRIYLPRHYDSAAVREASLSLGHKTYGWLTVGLTEGIDSKFGLGGHSHLSASGGLSGDFNNIRWAAADIGLSLGRVGSENFPKIQYISPQFVGLQFGIEWFTNAQSGGNRSSDLSLPSDGKIDCPNHEPLYFRREAKTFSDDEALDDKEFCWRLSPDLERWNAKSKRAIQGAGVGMSYTYDHKDKLSLTLAARYGIVFEDAYITDLKENTSDTKEDASDFPHSVHLQEQAAGAGVALRWGRYRFAAGGNVLFPSRYEYLDTAGMRASEFGTQGWSWSFSTSVIGFHPKPKSASSPQGTFSIAFAEGEIREHPQKDLGKVFLLSVGTDYPIGEHVFVLFDYWYGDAILFYRRPPALEVPLYGVSVSREHAVVFGLRAQF